MFSWHHKRRHKISSEELSDQQQLLVDSHFERYESEKQLINVKEVATVFRQIRQENHIVKDLRKVLGGN